MKLSVVIPLYNEAEYFPALLERVRAVALEKEIIVVEDCSTDGTREIARELQSAGGWPGDPRNTLKVVFHDRNRGKGAAIRTGLSLVSGDIVVIQDADLEYDPKDYPALIEPILAGHADAVYGSRFLGAPHRTHMFWHFAGNRFLTFV
jgi:glycosyltransferase involved in cell wall biosynthesis